MITIISASNRVGNLSALFANYCKGELERKGEKVQLFELNSLPETIHLNSVYEYESSVFSSIAKKYIQAAEKFLFVVPEYNGSFPGILKLFIDAVHPSNFKDKKAALIGVAAGRAGNLRGMDHLSDILNYLQVAVMPQKLPISRINELVNEQEIHDAVTIEEIQKQLALLQKF